MNNIIGSEIPRIYNITYMIINNLVPGINNIYVEVWFIYIYKVKLSCQISQIYKAI